MVLLVRMDTGLGAETSSSWDALVLSTQHTTTTHHARAQQHMLSSLHFLGGHLGLLQRLMQLQYVHIPVPTVPIHVDTWNIIKPMDLPLIRKKFNHVYDHSLLSLLACTSSYVTAETGDSDVDGALISLKGTTVQDATTCQRCHSEEEKA